MATTVEVDTSGLDRGVKQLERGLELAGRDAAKEAAGQVAQKLRAATPVRTGRLRSTVDVASVSDGAEVQYGGSLPYARYIAKRSHNVERATQGMDALFLGRSQANAREVCNAFQ